MGKIRVLIADYCAIFGEGLKYILNREPDMEVIAMIYNGEEAFTLAKKFIPDIAIIAANVPKFNGIKIARKIKKDRPSINILMLGTYDWESYSLASARLGASGYLLRSAFPDETVSAVRAIYKGEFVFNMKTISHILRRISIIGPDSKDVYEELNDREYEVLRLLSQGVTNDSIAKTLVISNRTVASHIAHIFRKLQVHSRTEAAIHALKGGYLDIDELP